MIVIGLGTGRCGTKSLVALLNAQKASVFFHEMLRANMRFEDTEWSSLNAINEFRNILNGGDKKKICVDLSDDYIIATYDKLINMDKVSFIGDVASYYLKYVPAIIRHSEDVRFICIKRDKEATVNSFIRKVTINKTPRRKLAERVVTSLTGRTFHQTMNHWVVHDGTVWRCNALFDKLFPKFNTTNLPDGIRKYWDMYYDEATLLNSKYPDNFKIFELEDLNAKEGQQMLLAYAGYVENDMILKIFHENKTYE